MHVLLYLLNAADGDPYGRAVRRLDDLVNYTIEALQAIEHGCPVRVFCLYFRGDAVGPWQMEGRRFEITAGTVFDANLGSAVEPKTDPIQEFFQWATSQVGYAKDVRYSLLIGGHGFGPAGLFRYGLGNPIPKNAVAQRVRILKELDFFSALLGDKANVEWHRNDSRRRLEQVLDVMKSEWVDEIHTSGAGIQRIWNSDVPGAPSLTLTELRQKLDLASNLHLSCLILNSCFMSSIEVFYELKDEVDAILAFERDNWRTLDPRLWLDTFGCKKISADAILRNIVEVEGTNSTDNFVLTAVSTRGVSTLRQYVDVLAYSLGEYLAVNPAYRIGIVDSARNAAKISFYLTSFGIEGKAYLADIGVFCEGLLNWLEPAEDDSTTTSVLEAARNLRHAVEGAGYQLHMHANPSGSLTGTSIYFPRAPKLGIGYPAQGPVLAGYFPTRSNASQSNNATLRFARDSKWTDFVRLWINKF